MLPQNDYLIEREFLDYRRHDLMAEAGKLQLLRRAGMARRPWLTCQICRTLWQLGHLMVAAGRRLEQRYAVPGLSHA
jgi:hypothetical protein